MLWSLIGILRLYQTFSTDIPVLHFLFLPMGGRNSDECRPSWSCKAKSSMNSQLFSFHRTVLNALICVLFLKLKQLVWLFCACSLAIYKGLYLLLSGAGHRVGKCMGNAHIALGVSGPVGVIFRWSIPTGSWVGFLMEFAKQ